MNDKIIISAKKKAKIITSVDMTSDGGNMKFPVCTVPLSKLLSIIKGLSSTSDSKVSLKKIRRLGKKYAST